MTKIARKAQKIFGSNAGTNEISQVGSLAASAPVYTTDPDMIQSLSNYLAGWFNVVIGGNSPAIQDMNALCYLFAYQIAYMFQAGVSEWNSATTYYIGSFASDGAGSIYVSLTDGNLNHALSDGTNWTKFTALANTSSINPGSTPTVTLTAADIGKTFLINSANGAVTFNLPTPSTNAIFTFKDTGGVASQNNITISGTGNKDGLTGNYLCAADYGFWSFVCDGTNWWLNT